MILAPAPVNLNEPLVLALARARARGESAYQVAARAQVHPSELSKWANGRRTPTPAQAERVAAVSAASPKTFSRWRWPSERAKPRLDRSRLREEPTVTAPVHPHDSQQRRRAGPRAIGEQLALESDR